MVARVECVRGVNEDESPFLLVVLFAKEGTGGVYCTLDPSLEAGAELRIAARIFRLSTS